MHVLIVVILSRYKLITIRVLKLFRRANMEQRDHLVQYLHRYLSVARVKDYCPNGLQVEGRAEIKKIVTGVTANQRLIDRAIDLHADALLVHHGYFWKGEASTIVGMKKRRIQRLLERDINLFAYHLPLDLHADVGNNAQLARVLNWTLVSEDLVNGLLPIVRRVQFDVPQSGEQVVRQLFQRLGREPMHIVADRPIKTIALCTGAAQSYIHDAVALGVDAFLSGEISEQTVHEAQENNLHYFAAGHHATERYGVKALGEHLAKQFDVECEFVDIDNPV